MIRGTTTIDEMDDIPELVKDLVGFLVAIH